MLTRYAISVVNLSRVTSPSGLVTTGPLSVEHSYRSVTVVISLFPVYSERLVPVSGHSNWQNQLVEFLHSFDMYLCFFFLAVWLRAECSFLSFGFLQVWDHAVYEQKEWLLQAREEKWMLWSCKYLIVNIYPLLLDPHTNDRYCTIYIKRQYLSVSN